MTSRTCPACQSSDRWTTTTGANGGYGPTLLPQLGGLFRSPKFQVVVCGQCGHTAFFAVPETLRQLKEKRPSRWSHHS